MDYNRIILLLENIAVAEVLILLGLILIFEISPPFTPDPKAIEYLRTCGNNCQVLN